MAGIISRMNENIDFFIDITFHLKSGTKIFTGKIIPNQNSFFWDFNGVQKTISAKEISGCIMSCLPNYEGGEIIYSERGTRIIIDISDRNVKMRREDNLNNIPDTANQSGREYVVSPAAAKDLLNELGILAKNGKLKNDKIRKYNQTDYFTELFGKLIDEIIGNYKIPAKKELLIIDCACGKSYLSFVLNFYMTEIRHIKCRFIGIDYSETVISASKRTAENLGYKNMEFVQADLKNYIPPSETDAVISLHACDTATDMAIALGIRTKAKAIMCVPCCHKDILKQYSYEPFAPIIKHGILKARLADTLTDGLRSIYLESVGYKVSLIEYISPLETPKNIMIRAVLDGKKNEDAAKEYRELKKILNVLPAIEIYSESQNYHY